MDGTSPILMGASCSSGLPVPALPTTRRPRGNRNRESHDMNIRFVSASFLIAASLVATIIVGRALPAFGQAQAAAISRTADGKANLSGIWQAMNTANWDLETHGARPGPVTALGAAFSVPPGVGVVDGGEIPYQPDAAAK